MTAFALLVLAVLATVLFTMVITVVMTSHRHGATRPEPSVTAGGAARSIESRLAEADDLRRRGVITADEFGEHRQRILGEV